MAKAKLTPEQIDDLNARFAAPIGRICGVIVGIGLLAVLYYILPW
jgi:hypothetical protein